MTTVRIWNAKKIISTDIEMFVVRGAGSLAYRSAGTACRVPTLLLFSVHRTVEVLPHFSGTPENIVDPDVDSIRTKDRCKRVSVVGNLKNLLQKKRKWGSGGHGSESVKENSCLDKAIEDAFMKGCCRRGSACVKTIDDRDWEKTWEWRT
jgi:hypothetical protein